MRNHRIVRVYGIVVLGQLVPLGVEQRQDESSGDPSPRARTSMASTFPACAVKMK